MKKIILLSLLVTCFSTITFSQSIGIGTTTPNASSILEIKASNKGLLIPRTSTTSRTAIVTPAKGLMVYDTTTNSFWYHNGSTWTQIDAGGGSGWLLTGNASTDSITNFIGTTNVEPLVFRANNVRAGYIGSGTSNTSFGYQAFNANISGNYNTAAGTYSLSANTKGFNNTAFGSYALLTNNTGSFNVAAGSDALHNNTSGSYNCAVGTQTLYINTLGNQNTAIGYEALQLNNTGSGNVANGFEALLSNTTGVANNATGYQSLYNNKDGHDNTGVGYSALFSNISGTGNTGIGNFSLYTNTGSYNTANGHQSLFYNKTGNNNTAAGYASLYYNTAGNGNTANGYFALFNNTTGYSNIAIGDHALFSNTIESNNVAIGDSALFSIGTGASSGFGEENTAIGSKALYSTTWGNFNTANGDHALYSNATGSENTAIGDYTDVNANNYNNSSAFGAEAIITSNQQVRVGNGSVLSIGGHVGWSTLSDGRVKKNIKQNVPGLVFINKLQPITYNLDLEAADNIIQPPVHKNKDGNVQPTSQQELESRKTKEQVVYTGFVAQDVEKAAKSLNYDFSGVDAAKNSKDLYGLRYAEFVVPLVKAVQEQQAIIEDQNKKIDLQQQQINALLSDVEQLKQKINTPVK